MKSTARKVVVALRMAGIAGQDKLNGIFECLSRGNRWLLSIYRTRHEFTAETVRHELERGADGFIVGIPETDDAIAEIAKSGKPVIVMNVPARALAGRDLVEVVQSDSRSVGREAAAELLRQGVYRSYGYVGYRTDDSWSRERGAAFREALEEAGFLGSMFDAAHYPGRLEDRGALVRWLKTLPKPCGILAACDDRAYEVLDACREATLKVPADVGVLGVNNDPILCENAEPRLSSVQPDFVGEGRLAAELLDRLMNGTRTGRKTGGGRAVARRNGPEPHTVGVKRIVHRDSTYPESQSGRLVQRALAFIAKNALSGISVADVAKALKVSEQLLALRFRELHHHSVYATILGVRLEEVKRRLRTTSDPIGRIAVDCGWENPASLMNLFKRLHGVSMRDWRRRLKD